MARINIGITPSKFDDIIRTPTNRKITAITLKETSCEGDFQENTCYTAIEGVTWFTDCVEIKYYSNHSALIRFDSISSINYQDSKPPLEANNAR